MVKKASRRTGEHCSQLEDRSEAMLFNYSSKNNAGVPQFSAFSRDARSGRLSSSRRPKKIGESNPRNHIRIIEVGIIYVTPS
jgi:hypothetical protein